MYYYIKKKMKWNKVVLNIFFISWTLKNCFINEKKILINEYYLYKNEWMNK